jgi:DNA-binding PadR family transcriptional regulator
MTRHWRIRLLILGALADGSRDGSGIIAAVGARSAGRVRLGAGSLLAALFRLRSERLIAIDREEIVGQRLRRYYRLTPAGRDQLALTAHRSEPVHSQNTDERWIP